MAQVQALDRGAWGNSLQVTAVAEDTPSVATQVAVGGGGAAGNPSINLVTGVGVEPGTLLEFLDNAGNVTFRQKVESVSGKTVTFGAAGLEQTVADDTKVRSAEFALQIAYYRVNPKTQKEEIDTSISETFRNLTLDPRHSRYFQRVIGVIPATVDERNEGESSLIRVRDDLAAAAAQAAERPAPDLLMRTTPDGQVVPVGLRLTGGDDQLGALADSDLVGTDAVDPADRTGLQALKNVEEISIVAIPGRTTATVQNAVLAHCELMRYRFGVLDSVRGLDPNGATLDQVQAQRSLYDSKYGALYYPWLVIDDPFPQNPAVAEPVKIPPSGHMIGIYARSDIERGVHKAPANEVVRGINDLQVKVVKEQHDILNPRNVNVLRDFRDQGRGLRVWGARAVIERPGLALPQRPAPVQLRRGLDRPGHAVGRVRAERLPALGPGLAERLGVPDGGLAGRRADGPEARAGLLREVRRDDDEPVRHRQRAADHGHRHRPGEAGRVRHDPHRPVGRRLDGRGSLEGSEPCLRAIATIRSTSSTSASEIDGHQRRGLPRGQRAELHRRPGRVPRGHRHPAAPAQEARD